MCGLFGAIGNYDTEKVKILCMLNEDRGNHSTGIYNGQEIVKQAIPAREFVCENAKYFIKADFIMGHTRYATKGEINNENAHPFCIDNIIGTHNGIIYNFDKKLEHINKKYKVDSMIIFHVLNDGLKKLQLLEGYWGLAWYDRRTPDTYYLSCHNGELHYAIDNGALYYASEKYHLKAITNCKIKKVKTNKILKINIYTLAVTHTCMKFKEYSKPLPVISTAWDNCQWDDFTGTWNEKEKDKKDDNYYYGKDDDKIPLYGKCEFCGCVDKLDIIEDIEICDYCAKIQGLKKDDDIEPSIESIEGGII